MFDIHTLLQIQLNQVQDWHQQPLGQVDPTSFLGIATLQHYSNYELWHQEDLARDPDSSDSQLATVKRNIDRLNQKRNDLIELINTRSKQQNMPVSMIYNKRREPVVPAFQRHTIVLLQGNRGAGPVSDASHRYRA